MTTEDFIMTSADDAWDTLRVGESLLVKGKLANVRHGEGKGNHREPSIVIAFTDWSMVALECDHPRNLKPIALASYVTVRAVRVEDGLKAAGMTLVGFLRPGRMNIYAGAGRLK